MYICSYLIQENLEAGDWSVSHESRNPSGRVSKLLSNMNDVNEDDDDSSEDWINCIPNPVDSSSDGIEFVNSNGDIIAFDDEDDSDSSDTTRDRSSATFKPLLQYMYIQMEFCEKSTLR